VWSSVYSFQASMADSLTPGVVLPISSGGTGSSTQNFVDLTSSQMIGGTKAFTGLVSVNGPQLGQFTVSGSSFTPLYVQNRHGASSRACFCEGGWPITGLVKPPNRVTPGATFSPSPAGGEPLNSVGATSGVSIDDRTTPGATRRWVVYADQNSFRF